MSQPLLHLQLKLKYNKVIEIGTLLRYTIKFWGVVGVDNSPWDKGAFQKPPATPIQHQVASSYLSMWHCFLVAHCCSMVYRPRERYPSPACPMVPSVCYPSLTSHLAPTSCKLHSTTACSQTHHASFLGLSLATTISYSMDLFLRHKDVYSVDVPCASHCLSPINK